MRRESWCLMAMLGFLAGCSPVPQQEAAQPLPEQRAPGNSRQIVLPKNSPKLAEIHVTSVRTATIPKDLIVAPGKIEINPNRMSRVLPPVPGRVTSVKVRLGDAVRQGQPLATMESPEAYAAMANYRQAEALVQQSNAALVKATADVNRLQLLYEHRAAAQKDLLAAQNELAQAKAAVAQARAASEEARQRLLLIGLKPGKFDEQVVVRAPVSGKVLEINVVPGEYRNDPSAPLMTIADLSSVWVSSNVPESAIRLINLGESIEIRLAAYPGRVFHARVTRIADTLDPRTRTVKVQAELANPRELLRPEMFGEIRHSHGSQTLPVVPATAVLEEGGGAAVYRERAPGVFERVRVRVGAPVDGEVPVLSGLKPGDRVVANGGVLLKGR